jgi:hypothetical protein
MVISIYDFSEGGTVDTSLAPGQYRVFKTYQWPENLVVTWSVRPLPGEYATIALRALAIESSGLHPYPYSYYLTVWNPSQIKLSGFQAFWEFEEMPVGGWRILDRKKFGEVPYNIGSRPLLRAPSATVPAAIPSAATATYQRAHSLSVIGGILTMAERFSLTK